MLESTACHDNQVETSFDKEGELWVVITSRKENLEGMIYGIPQILLERWITFTWLRLPLAVWCCPYLLRKHVCRWSRNF